MKTYKRNIFYLLISGLNYLVFGRYGLEILYECIKGFRTEMTNRGNTLTLVSKNSVVRNMVEMKWFTPVQLSVIFLSVVVLTILGSHFFEQNKTLIFGTANFIFAGLWFRVYFHQVIHFPNYGYSFFTITDPRPFLNQITSIILLGVITFIVTLIYSIVVYFRNSAVNKLEKEQKNA